MPPQKSLTPKTRSPPRTPPELRSLKLSISFRADQKAALERLKADHRLSRLCQQAVDCILLQASVLVPVLELELDPAQGQARDLG